MKPRGMLFGFGLLTLRLLLAAWFGAAVLFVITSVAEQTAPEFDSVVRDQLATIRFPLYYAFGCGIYAGAAVALLLVWITSASAGRRRLAIATAVIVCSAAVFVYDYYQVYLPLQQVITPPGSVRGQEFVRLHKASEYANTVHVLLMLLAAVLMSWPYPTAEQHAGVSST